jgi:hypothetical protein
MKSLNRNGGYMSVCLYSATGQDSSGLFFPQAMNLLTVRTARFVNHKLRFPSKDYVFLMIVRTDNNYLSNHHQQLGICNGYFFIFSEVGAQILVFFGSNFGFKR